jgi:hypothetical protein
MDINPSFSGNNLSYTVLRLNQSSALSYYGENKPYTSFMYGTTEVSRTYMDGLFKLNFKSYGNGGAQSGFNFQTLGATTSAMMIFNSGNIGVNTTTDAGFKLDVNGTARLNGSLTFQAGGSNLIGPAGTAFTMNSAVTLDLTSASFRFYTSYTSGGVSNAAFMVTPQLYIGTGIPTFKPSAQLELDSTTKGFLPPRMTLAQRTAISSPASGLIL